MDCAVEPVLQVLPVALLDVNVVVLPVQIDKPVLLIVGVAGIGFTVTVIATQVVGLLLQSKLFTK
jgi:hypothetical protein